MDMEARIDRQLSAMSDDEKCRLLDSCIGPVTPGHEPDPKADEAYLRGIVADQLREHDARVEAIEKSGLAALERRVAALEKRKPGVTKADLDVIAKVSAKVMREYVDASLEGATDEFVKYVDEAIHESGLMRHMGTWEPDRDYRKGNCVLQGGATWIAVGDAPKGSRPGSALEWRLIVKGEGKP